MSTKTTGLAPKSFKSTKFIVLALLVLGLYLVIQDPTGSAAAVQSGLGSLQSAANSLQVFWSGLGSEGS